MAKNKNIKATKSYANKIIALFNVHYPDADCALNYKTPFELLVATILSAQCTDARVNKVTPALFSSYPDASKMSQTTVESIEIIIKSCGFYHNKAINIHKMSCQLMELYNGEVPKKIEELVKLAGVGRKTANVVLGNAFGIPGLTVDTHLGRVSRRLALTDSQNPVQIEKDLMKIIPKKIWTIFSHQSIAHGRAICKSQRPLCQKCFIDFCPSKKN